ncbi:MAG: hypothetical protein R6W73_05340 [Candidatus Saliniplasma sp.]
MRYLATRCPECISSFYKKIERGPFVDIKCPYCGEKYVEKVNENKVKDADFYWELYINLYPRLKNRYHNYRLLKVGSIFLSIAILINSISIIKGVMGPGFTLENVSVFISGLILSGMIFLGFAVIGTVSVLLKYSYSIAISGAFFGGLTSILLYIYGVYSGISAAPFSLSFNTIIAFFLSMISLFIILHNRWEFLRS